MSDTPKTNALIAEFSEAGGIVRSERLRAMNIALVDLARDLEAGSARVVARPPEDAEFVAGLKETYPTLDEMAEELAYRIDESLAARKDLEELKRKREPKEYRDRIRDLETALATVNKRLAQVNGAVIGAPLNERSRLALGPVAPLDEGSRLWVALSASEPMLPSPGACVRVAQFDRSQCLAIWTGTEWRLADGPPRKGLLAWAPYTDPVEPPKKRSPEWWLARARAEGDRAVSAGADLWPSTFLAAVRNLTFMARTSGGTAGRDDGLCAALDAVESLLPPLDSAPEEHHP